MFNLFLGIGPPPAAPSSFNSNRSGGIVSFFWINTTSQYVIQLGYDALGGTNYIVYIPAILPPGSVTYSDSGGHTPFNAPGAISFAVRYIGNGYVSPWSNQQLP